MDHRAGLEDVEKRTFLPLLGLELRPLGHPLYRLRYPFQDETAGPEWKWNEYWDRGPELTRGRETAKDMRSSKGLLSKCREI
jgi:hypothetical protein